MALKSNFVNMSLSLFVTCFACSAILAGVYAVTAEPIAKTNENILKTSIGKVLPDGGEISDAKHCEVGGLPSEYYTCLIDGTPAAYAIKSTVVGFGGPVAIMVGITVDGTIYNTSVLSHTETPGLGAKCTSDEKFIKQWQNLKPSINGGEGKVLKVKKDGGDIDAITASTITSRAYSLAVNNAVEAFLKITKEENYE
ncbi:MAG: RnfABCDGE type electron transport complex subunit G [Candidatus Cryptobacteroides sp.]